MAEPLRYHLVTPEKLFASGEAQMVVIPGALGDFGVMKHHAPFVSLVRPGVIEIHKDGGTVERVFISDGYAETHENLCTVLAETLERAQDIDPARAKQAHDEAQSALARAAAGHERAQAEKSLALAEARLQAAG